jgi:hypothetical protein
MTRKKMCKTPKKCLDFFYPYFAECSKMLKIWVLIFFPSRPLPNSLASSEIPHFCMATASSLIRSISDSDKNTAEHVLQAHQEYIKGCD